MQYLLLCCINETDWGALGEAERDTIMAEYHEWIADTERTGHHVATAKLHDTGAATTIRAPGGQRTLTDGPFAETREQIGGYHVLECGDLDEAIGLASRIPTLRVGGTIEVRPLMHSDY